VSEAREMLEKYLRQIGISGTKDPAQHFQLTLLRQMTSHLEAVLEEEGISPEQRHRILQAVIYGGVPTVAEAEVRENLSGELRRRISETPVVRLDQTLSDLGGIRGM